MAKKTREIFKLFDNISDSLSIQGGEINKTLVNNLLSRLYSPGPSFQYIFDFATRKFIYVSQNVTNVIGESPHTFNVDEFMERIHPNDLEHFLHCQEVGSYFLFNIISKEQIPHYKISYQYRFKNKQGVYELFLHQAIASSWDDAYKMASSLANHSNINHITSVNNKKMSFININGGQSYYGITCIDDLHAKTSNSKLITSRELEVLSLIAEGFSNGDIADYLNISTTTVATHRKNILKKTKFKTLAQATAYFIREGLI